MTFTSLVWWFLRPSHSLVFLGLAGLLLRGRLPRAGRLFAGTGLVGLLLGAFAPLGIWLIAPLEERFTLPPNLDHVDGIIVLAGSEVPALTHAYDQPHVNDHSGRLITAIGLAVAYPTATLVHSGGSPLFVDEETGAMTGAPEVAAEIFRLAGIPDGRLVFEKQSRNTCASAQATRELMNPAAGSRWLLVTSAFHMPRAVACFRAVDWEVVPYPTAYRQATGRGFSAFDPRALSNLRTLDLAAHEWIGLAYYRIAGRTDELFPRPRDDDGE